MLFICALPWTKKKYFLIFCCILKGAGSEFCKLSVEIYTYICFVHFNCRLLLCNQGELLGKRLNNNITTLWEMRWITCVYVATACAWVKDIFPTALIAQGVKCYTFPVFCSYFFCPPALLLPLTFNNHRLPFTLVHLIFSILLTSQCFISLVLAKIKVKCKSANDRRVASFSLIHYLFCALFPPPFKPSYLPSHYSCSFSFNIYFLIVLLLLLFVFDVDVMRLKFT